MKNYEINYKNDKPIQRKKTKEMDLVLTPTQKKMQKTTIKVIGRMMANHQEKEHLSGKMEPSKKESLKMVPLNINRSI